MSSFARLLRAHLCIRAYTYACIHARICVRMEMRIIEDIRVARALTLAGSL